MAKDGYRSMRNRIAKKEFKAGKGGDVKVTQRTGKNKGRVMSDGEKPRVQRTSYSSGDARNSPYPPHAAERSGMGKKKKATAKKKPKANGSLKSYNDMVKATAKKRGK